MSRCNSRVNYHTSLSIFIFNLSPFTAIHFLSKQTTHLQQNIIIHSLPFPSLQLQPPARRPTRSQPTKSPMSHLTTLSFQQHRFQPNTNQLQKHQLLSRTPATQIHPVHLNSPINFTRSITATTASSLHCVLISCIQRLFNQ